MFNTDINIRIEKMTKLNDLTDLAEFLKGLKNDDPSIDKGFDMQWGYHNKHFTNHPCGTAMCIGGWVQNFNVETRDMSLADAVMTICPEGAKWDEVDELCYPLGASGWNATPQQAARAVEILRDTGFCDWIRAAHEVPS
jgi:hypothetical protein